MLNLLRAFRQDEHGVILSTEIVIVGTVLVLGAVTGLTFIQKSVSGELTDLAKAMHSIDQSYSFSGQQMSCFNNGTRHCSALTAGSRFQNSESSPNACRNQIAGCEGSELRQSENPGNGCGACGSCGSQCGLNGVCGSCGGAGSGWIDSNRPYSVSTGVPKMRVSEYPGTGNVPRTSNAGKSPIRFPDFEASPSVYPRHEGHEHSSGGPLRILPETVGPNNPICPILQNQPLPPDSANAEQK